MSNENKNRDSFLETLFGILFFLVFRISSWICSAPMWITLILHFTHGLSLWWFFGTLAAWILVGILRYFFIRFARWGADSAPPELENKNPYSNKK